MLGWRVSGGFELEASVVAAAAEDNSTAAAAAVISRLNRPVS